MLKHPMLEHPDPLISFDQFADSVQFYGQRGLLGFFNFVEATEVFMIVEKQSPPVNVFSLIVFEEHKTPPSDELVILNAPKRITLPGHKGCVFGVCRYFKPVEEFIASLQRFQSEGLWDVSGATLSVGAMIPLLPQFIPADQTDRIPLNCVLKNNFWNGSYALELFDNEKTRFSNFFAKPRELQILSREINKHAPLKLASLSDRLGNIVIQIPSNIGAFKLGSNRNDENSYSFAWREGVKKRKTQLVAVSEIDNSVIAFEANNVPNGRSWTLPIGKAPEIDRTYLFDQKNQILLAATSSLAFIREVNLEVHPVGFEPRAIYIPTGKGEPEKTHLGISSSMEPSRIGYPNIFDYKKWMQRRVYQAEKDSLMAQREFVQYGLIPNGKNEHARALSDIRALLQRYGIKEVWLWDPYLSALDIMKTLFFNPYLGSRLCALTSGKACGLAESMLHGDKQRTIDIKTWKTHQVDFLNTPGNNYRGLHLEFKISYGPGADAFHDRFLIFPDTDHGPVAWSLGTSVNSLGKSHHILQKVAHARLVADAFQTMWGKLKDNKYLIWKRP